MTDFLDSLVQQVAQTVAQAQANPATIPVNPTQGFPVRATPNDIYAVNQNLGGLLQQAGQAGPQPVPSMLGQAAQSPAAQLAATIGTQPRVMAPPAPMTPRGPYSVVTQGPLAPPTPGSAVSVAGQGATARAMESAVAPSTLASVEGAAARETAEAAVEKGLTSRLRSVFPSLAGASITKGSILKGGAASVGGLMASGWLDARNFGGENSEMDQALKGGALGAGLGAGAALTLGLGAGPVGWAALGGAALFAAGNMAFGDNDSTEDKMDKAIGTANETINNLISNPAFGIDPDTASQIKLQVAATTEFYKNAGDLPGLQAYLAGLSQTVPSFLMEASSRNQANQQKMQMQAAFGPVYSRLVDRSTNAAKQALDIQMEAANAIRDPQVSAAIKNQAAQQYSAQMDTMTAYAQQIAAAPQQLKPSEQMVVDNTQTLMQQFMGGG